MNFTSPTEHAIHVALTSGHTCVIPSADKEPEGVEVAEMFRREALARGAEPVGMAMGAADPGSGPSRTEVITKALQTMLDGNEEGDFKKDGTPDLNAVSRRCGFKVPRDEAEAIFRTLQEVA